MKPGAISAERVSRRFRVHAERSVTLKEAIVRRRRTKPVEVWALRDVSFGIESGEAVGLIGRNGSGKTTLLRLIAGIFKPTAGHVAVGGSVGSLIGLGAGFHPEFTGRENVYLNGSIHGLARQYIREQLDEITAFAELDRFIDLPVRTYSSGMYMRLGFSIATHLDPDILLLDEVFAVGDEAFQRKCFGKIFELKSRGRTIIFVSHSAAAVESLCERSILLNEGRVEYDGTTHDAVTRYHALLAAEESPAELGAGLIEWGSGEAHLSEVRLEDADGLERRQYLAGEPFVVRLRVEAASELPAAPHVSIEVREANGFLIGAAVQDTEELGWDGAGGEHWIRFEVERLPLADGRFHISAALSDPQGSRLYHRVERAAQFVVYPGERLRGPVRFDGNWSLAESPSEVEIG